MGVAACISNVGVVFILQLDLLHLNFQPRNGRCEGAHGADVDGALQDLLSVVENYGGLPTQEATEDLVTPGPTESTPRGHR